METATFIHLGGTELPDNTKSGQGSTVRRRATLSGRDIVEKTINPDGAVRDDPDRWWSNQEHAHEISDAVRAMGNPAYDIPKTFMAHDRIREEFADGTILRETDRAILDQNRPILIQAVGNLINDMSEMRPTRGRRDKGPMPKMWIRDSKNLLNILIKKITDIIDTQDVQTICDAYAFLDDLPENQEMIFSHNDLHPGNIIFNPQTGRVSIIDFELSGYQSKFAIMYGQPILAQADLWDYVNHLPRSKNPNLTWNFDPHKAKMFDLLRVIIRDVVKYSPLTTSATDTQNMVAATIRHCQALRFYMGAIRINDQNAAARDTHMLPVAQPNTDTFSK